ncbi:lysophospholipase [Clostridiaceae bacterium M8S5]|nr:lysophospholipase [Clostridiaceae bacterium M8S5]
MNQSKVTKLKIINKNNLKLNCVIDMVEEPIAILIIVHGFGEYLEKYDHVKDAFNNLGYGVCRFDIRGHGMSEGERGHLELFDDFIKDTDDIVDYIKREYEGIPIIMIGHSMGGLITALYGIKHGDKILGQVLLASATSEPKQSRGVKGRILKSINRFAPKIKIKNPVARDELELKSVTLNFYVQFLVHAITMLNNNLNKYRCPCFIMHGEEDKLIDKNASIEFYSNISSQDKEIKIYEGMKHVLLKDIYEVYQDIHIWISKRINHKEN